MICCISIDKTQKTETKMMYFYVLDDSQSITE